MKYNRSINILIIISLIIISLTGIANANETGYLNRHVFMEDNPMTGPAFNEDGVFIARSNEGIYQFSWDGKLKKFYKYETGFLKILSYDRFLYILTDNKGKRNIEILEVPSFKTVKKLEADRVKDIHLENLEISAMTPRSRETDWFKAKLIAVKENGMTLYDLDGSKPRDISTENFKIKAVLISDYRINIQSEKPDIGKNKIEVFSLSEKVYEWESSLFILNEEESGYFFVMDEKLPHLIKIFTPDGEPKDTLTFEENTTVSKSLFFYIYNDDSIITLLKQKDKPYSLLTKINLKTKQVLWSVPVAGRITTGTKDIKDEYLYIIRDLQAKRFVLNRVNIKDGRLDRQVYLGEMQSPRLYFWTESLEFPEKNDYDKGYIYLTNRHTRQSCQLSSLTVFDRELEGEHKFVLSPADHLQYTYARLKNASNRDPWFKKYMSEKFGNDPVARDTDKIRDAVNIYNEAKEKNTTNPFLDVYYILARLELGATPEVLKDEISLIDKKCNYDVFELSLIGALFYRYRHYQAGEHFLKEAVKYAPASSPDYKRAYADLYSSPGFYIVRILNQMARDKEPQYQRMIELTSLMSEMLPSCEYNYYAWSGFSNYYRAKGDAKKAKEAAKKASQYFYHNEFFPPWKVALFDVISVLTVILGVLFPVFSVWFTFRSFRRKNHYLSEKSGIKEPGGIIELYQTSLSPGEKNLLGFLISLGILSIMVDGILLILKQLTRETYQNSYNFILGLSVLTGVIIGIYLFIVLLRAENKHYEGMDDNRKKSFRDVLNNSFLAFMVEKERKILISLSIAGVLLAFILMNLMSGYVFLSRVPASIAGGRYGSDQSLSLLRNQLEKTPNNPWTQLLMGYEYLLRGRYGEAKNYYEKFLAVHPNDISARANLALILSKTSPPTAVSMLEKLLQNRRLQKNYPYADRVYYDLVLLEKEIFGKDAVSPYKKILEETKSATVEANGIVHPGRKLLFPPTLEQEKLGIPRGFNYSSIFYSYLFPFVSVFQGGQYYSAAALIIAVAAYWLWTLILILSFNFIKESGSMPHYCKRCGKLICEKCILPYDTRQWCRECDKNKGFHLPSVFEFLIPGIHQLQGGNTIKGTLCLVSFLYGLFYCFILFFPLRRSIFTGSGRGTYLGILQGVTVPDTIFPYNAAKDPVLGWFVLCVLIMTVVPLILNAIELLRAGKYKERPPIPVFETQLLEVREFKTRLIQETKLMNMTQTEATKKIKSADPAEMSKIADRIAKEKFRKRD